MHVNAGLIGRLPALEIPDMRSLFASLLFVLLSSPALGDVMRLDWQISNDPPGKAHFVFDPITNNVYRGYVDWHFGVSNNGIRGLTDDAIGWMDPATEAFDLTIDRALGMWSQGGPFGVAKQMNLPLEKVCNNISQQMFKGIAKAVNPNAEYSTIRMGTSKCVESIEIP